TLSPAAFATMVGRMREELAAAGRADAPFDIAVLGLSEPSGADAVAAFGAAGATWWLESLSPQRGTFEELLARIEAGPPTA
ncbi:MAG: LLM class flavin-dependent oxidoreductase, partial [Chloroflexi bacterium]|nr:LLM class flavin-dependent oxidoreductase [Chloroflexota bacterium]